MPSGSFLWTQNQLLECKSLYEAHQSASMFHFFVILILLCMYWRHADVFLIMHWLLCHCSWILIVCFTSCTRLRATWISAKKCCKVGCSFVRYRPVQVFWMCLSKRSPCYCIRWKHQQSTNDIVCVAGMTFKPFTGSFFCRVEFAGYLPMDLGLMPSFSVVICQAGVVFCRDLPFQTCQR